MTEKTRGRPPFEITDEVIEKAEWYASRGLTKEQIAGCLGISYETLNEKCKAFPDFSDAIRTGIDKGIAHMANLLIKNAENGNATAQIFYLKAKGGWKENQGIEHTGKDGAPLQFETHYKNASDAMSERFNQILGPKKEEQTDGDK